jgi:cobalt-zinc-cadmium efflux system outer membrane protein
LLLYRKIGIVLAVSIVAISSGAIAADATPDAAESLTLQQVEKLFVERSRELRAANRAVDSAEADIISAGARPNPNLSLSTASINPGNPGAGSVFNKRVDTTIGLSQVFERGNKAGLRTAAATATATAVRADRMDIERMQRVVLHGAYYDLLLAQEKVRVAGETAVLFQKSLDALNIRLKAGDVAAVDVSRMSVDALRAQNDVRNARADFEKAQAALAYLIGAEQNASRLRAADNWPVPEKMTGTRALESAIATRADVQAAQARVQAAEQSRDLARSLRTRDITGGVQFERYPGNDPRNSVGFSVSIPLFTRYYYDGEIKRAESDLLAAQENVERVRALAATEINRAASDLDSNAERMQRFREVLLAAAEKAAQGAEFAHSKGAIGVMDLLDARRQLTATRLESLAVSSDYARALSAWRAATGALPALAKAGE